MRRLFYALGDAQLRRWMAAGRPLARADGGGLTFTLSANGTASSVMRYSRGQRRRELTIGQYPDLSLAAARKAARTLSFYNALSNEAHWGFDDIQLFGQVGFGTGGWNTDYPNSFSKCYE